MTAFHAFSRRVAHTLGHPITTALAVLIVIVWAATGPHFHYSDTWQLVINTGTTIATFIMIFIVQETQNVNDRALHAKLDELILTLPQPDNQFAGIEELPEPEIEALVAHEEEP